MAGQEQTHILYKLAEMDKKLDSLSKIEKRLSSIEKDIKIIKSCVDTENAEEFPYPKTGNSSSKPVQVAAAKHS